MARETLANFLQDYIGTGAGDRIAITADQDGGVPQGTGLGIEPGTEVQLLGPGNTSLLTEYLSHIVKNASNVQKFAGNHNEAQSSNRGDELVPNPNMFIQTGPGYSSVHVTYGTDWDIELDKFSNSLYFDETGLDSIISKTTGQVPSGEGPFSTSKRSAHNLLKGVDESYVGDSPKDFVVEASSMALRNNNRFNDATNNGFTEDSTSKPRNSSIQNLLIQTVAGKYDSNEHVTSIQKLSNVAAALMLRSTGYSTDVIPGSDDHAGVTLSIFEAAVRQGGLESQRIQAGATPEFFKQNVKGLQARTAQGAPDALGFPIKDGGRSIPLISGSLNADSFGSTYNHIVNFTGHGRKAHKVKAAISVIATYTLIRTLFIEIAAYIAEDDADEFNDIIGDVLTYASKGYAGPLPKGKSRRLASAVSNSWFQLNILTPLRIDYSQALQTGLNIMFGSSFPGNLTQESLNAAVEAAGTSSLHRYSDSPGYWSAVCDSVIREAAAFNRRIASIDVTGPHTAYESTIELVRFFNQDNRIIKFMNVMAMIGEKFALDANNIVGETSSQGKPFDADRVNNLPLSRPGKSRVGKGRAKDQRTEAGKPEGVLGDPQIAWSSTSTPSMYLLPVNVIRAVGRLNNSFTGPNPGAAMLGSQMVRNTYTSLDVDGSGNRIPGRVVKIVEDRLDAEYVPFYFHDLRTNEIVSFNAFLTELSDNIQANYNAVSGYGRMDPVQQYVNTTRSLRVGFTTYATNRSDFDEQWYKINKLVTMLYPQWSQGTFVHAGEVGTITIPLLGDVGVKGSDFYQPFSQVIGASPIIRLRIGDVIKGNYSRFNLARMFGIGDAEVTARYVGDDHGNLMTIGQNNFGLADITNALRDVALLVMMIIYGSPHGVVELASRFIPALPGPTLQLIGNAIADSVSAGLAKSLINGFAKLNANNSILRIIRDPESFNPTDGYDNALDRKGNIYTILPNMAEGYFCIDTGQHLYTTRRVNMEFAGDDGPQSDLSENGETIYRVTIKDEAAGDFNGKKVLVRHRDMIADPVRLFNASPAGNAFFITAGDGIAAVQRAIIENDFEGAPRAGGNDVANILFSAFASFFENPEAFFMRPETNPFVQAFQTTKGRGLAGVIKGINFNWLDDTIPWETDFNSRAPMGCEISFDFDVIHDIAPGLGHDGYNRAPLYNVGSIMRNISGDPYKEINSTSEIFFRRGGSTVPGSVTGIRSTGTTEGGGTS